MNRFYWLSCFFSFKNLLFLTKVSVRIYIHVRVPVHIAMSNLVNDTSSLKKKDIQWPLTCFNYWFFSILFLKLFQKAIVIRWDCIVLVFLSIILVFILIEYMYTYSLQSDTTAQRQIIRHTPSTDIVGDFSKSDNFVF